MRTSAETEYSHATLIGTPCVLLLKGPIIWKVPLTEKALFYVINVPAKTSVRPKPAARGDDTDCPFSRLCLHPRIILVLTSSAGPFKLERLTSIQSRRIAALLP
jgi:hypothetical protein